VNLSDTATGAVRAPLPAISILMAVDGSQIAIQLTDSFLAACATILWTGANAIYVELSLGPNINLSVNNSRHLELGCWSGRVTSPSFRAVVKLGCQVVGVIGMQDCLSRTRLGE
jgi:hypothetical protein